jgi:non-ribosomal peptide synthetase component F
MVFVAALKLLMNHSSGREDVRVATLSANRGQAKTDGLIGYFVNALILRTRVTPRSTCKDFLRQVREVCLTAYANADVPVEVLEAALDNRGRSSAAPLYRVMFNYRSLSTPPLIANGLTIASWDGKHRAGDLGVDVARLDVNFNLRELSTKLTGTVNFRTELFRQDGMDRFLRNYFGILNQIVKYPERRISGVKID